MCVCSNYTVTKVCAHMQNRTMVTNNSASNLLVRPDSSSEKVRYPLFISSVLGAKILEVAVCGRGCVGSEAIGAPDEEEPNIFVATACGLHGLACCSATAVATGAGANTLHVDTFGLE